MAASAQRKRAVTQTGSQKRFTARGTETEARTSSSTLRAEMPSISASGATIKRCGITMSGHLLDVVGRCEFPSGDAGGRLCGNQECNSRARRGA